MGGVNFHNNLHFIILFHLTRTLFIDFKREKSVVSSATANPEIVPCKFSIGDSSASEKEDEETSCICICMVTRDCDLGMQTDSKMSQRFLSKKQPRSLTECVQILNSDVSRCLV